ncbi:MAG: hypothetical protein KQJ78_18535 [Deltaproteobacteria bacterium]|nr:hypothetical protein [Deltaproteobacteria bacterium]
MRFRAFCLLCALALLLALAAGCNEGAGGGGGTSTDSTDSTEAADTSGQLFNTGQSQERLEEFTSEITGEVSRLMNAMDAIIAASKNASDPKEVPPRWLEFQDASQPLVIVPVGSFEKNRYPHTHGRAWSPLPALAGPPDRVSLPFVVEINERYEFWAVFRNFDKALNGRQVVFYWYHGQDPKLYTDPVVARVHMTDDLPYPVAMSYCWSAPASGSRLMAGLGLRSVTGFDEWNKSQCFGPRSVEVHLLKSLDADPLGNMVPIPEPEVLAEGSIEIREPGVVIYR